MDIKQKRGQILKELRMKKGLKQSEMADILGITPQAYQRYEYGTSEPNADGFSMLADFYGVTTDYLLGRESAADPINQLSSDILEREVLTEYFKLPKDVRQAILESMKKAALKTVAAEEPADTLTFTTTCGQLEDKAKTAEDEEGGKFA